MSKGKQLHAALNSNELETGNSGVSPGQNSEEVSPEIERDNSIEWAVYRHRSTASIRHKLFKRSTCIQAEK